MNHRVGLDKHLILVYFSYSCECLWLSHACTSSSSSLARFCVQTLMAFDIYVLAYSTIEDRAIWRFLHFFSFAILFYANIHLPDHIKSFRIYVNFFISSEYLSDSIQQRHDKEVLTYMMMTKTLVNEGLRELERTGGMSQVDCAVCWRRIKVDLVQADTVDERRAKKREQSEE